MIDSYWVVPETEDDIYHHGVKGMKWGVRKKRKDAPFSISKTTKRNTISYTMREGKKKVGVGYVDDFDNGETNINWVSVKKKYRGKGYAQKAMREIIKDAEMRGRSFVSLEVPTTSPDALHIYEKIGFKKVESITSSDDVWGGLTSMKLDLRKKG